MTEDLNLIHPKLTWEVRNCYVAREGYKLVTIDYNNLELLATGHQLKEVLGWSELVNIINEGEVPTDLHSKYAAMLMSREQKKDVTYEEFIANKKVKEYAAYRQKGKPMSLGRPGGMGIDTIGVQCKKEGIELGYKEIIKCDNESLIKRKFWQHCKGRPNLRIKRTGRKEWAIVYDEVVGLRDALDELYPCLKTFLKETHKKFIIPNEMKLTFNEWGEKEWEPYYKFNSMGVSRKYCTYTEFCNGFLMQSPSASMAKKAGYDMFRKFEDNPDVHMLFFIHDEFGLEIKDDGNLKKHIYEACEVMIDACRDMLYHVSCAVEWSINDYWSKANNQEDGVCYKKLQHKELQHLK